MNRSWIAQLLALLVVLVEVQAFAATTLYYQDFRHPSLVPNEGSNIPFAQTTIPWSAYFGTNATDITATTSNQGNRQVLINWSSGSPSSEGPGYAYTRDTLPGPNRIFALVSETFSQPFSFDDGALTASFRSNISHENIDVRLLINVGGNWYASAEGFNLPTGTQSNFSSSNSATIQAMSQSMELTTAASAWLNFTLDPGTGMALGAPVESDLTGGISQIGFFVVHPDDASGTVIARFDSLAITQVPEPKQMSLLAMGVAFWVLRRKRL